MGQANTVQEYTQREIAEELEGRTIRNVLPKYHWNHGSGTSIIVEFEEGDPVQFKINDPHVWMRFLA